MGSNMADVVSRYLDPDAPEAWCIDDEIEGSVVVTGEPDVKITVFETPSKYLVSLYIDGEQVSLHSAANLDYLVMKVMEEYEEATSE